MYSITKKAFAEAIGTFFLVFLACGTAIMTGDVVATSLAFGLVIVAMAYSIGDISGCHVNPAVSIAMLVSKKMSAKEFFVYIIAQFIGALVGAAALYGIIRLSFGFVPNAAAVNLAPGTDLIHYVSAGLIEIVLTFVFIYAILGVTSKTDNKVVTGIVIGLTLTLVHLIGINFTGTSVNPARSFGPAVMDWIFNGNTEGIKQVAIFLVSPLIGGALGALVYGLLHNNNNKTIAPKEKKTTPTTKKSSTPTTKK